MAATCLAPFLSGQAPSPLLPVHYPSQSNVLAYGTHDWTEASRPDAEAWTDVKTPGNGRTYSVGTMGITNADPSPGNPFGYPHFSTEPIHPPMTLQQSDYWHSNRRDVAVIQCAEPPSTALPTGIVWQQMFFGESHQPLPGAQFTFPKTIARAIAVYPQATPAATRIAICGETYDRPLPGGAVNLPPIVPMPARSGFLAVYDGDGNLKWSEMLTAPDWWQTTFVSDIAIRVETVGGISFDVVTFCGATTAATGIGWYSHGTPGNGAVRPFPPLTYGQTAPMAGGATDTRDPNNPFGSLNWDGFVGRFRHNQATGTRGLDFLSLVGSSHQDAMFGLAELDADVFAVVGTMTASVPFSLVEFPLNFLGTFNSIQPFDSFRTSPPFLQQMGVAMVFDASPIRVNPSNPNNVLVLTHSQTLGTFGERTVARDVCCQGGMVYVVGSTNDQGFRCSWPSFSHGSPYPTVSGGPAACSGFLLALDGNPFFHVVDTMFLGGRADVDRSEAVGISGWSEHPDHVTVVGRTSGAGNPGALFVARVFADTTSGSFGGAGPGLVTERILVASGSGEEYVAELDPRLYSSQAWIGMAAQGVMGYDKGPVLGDAFGGGISVDSNGRATVVGSTKSDDFPFRNGRPASSYPTFAVQTDAIRFETDLLLPGVCRTDGTSGWFPPLFTRNSGDGGTTPASALLPFGLQIGGPVPALQRMFLGFEGGLDPGDVASIVVDRPPQPSQSLGNGMFLQFDVPSLNPAAVPGMPGVELWTLNSPVFQYLPPHTGSLRIPLWTPGLPTGHWTFSLQVFASMAGAVPFAASPALVFGY